MVAVGTPYGVGVVSSAAGDGSGLAGLGAEDEYIGISRESVLLAGEFLAGICYESAVGTPAKLLGAAERFERKFELDLRASENINRIVFRDNFSVHISHV